jgi:two-component system chemotaxis response regulator CheB
VENKLAHRDFIAIGTSSGGVDALQSLVSQLPPDLPATLAIVMHVGAHASILPSLLTAAGPLPATHAKDGEPYAPGRIYVAPPDLHMVVEGAQLRIVKGAKENFARPAIDPLLRSTATEKGPRAVGVILTGLLDDGAAGLEAIQACGGATIVQDPDDAFAGDMPLHASPFADDILPLAALGARFVELTRNEPGRVARDDSARRGILERLYAEQRAWRGSHAAVRDLTRIAEPSTFTCPECSGALWRLNGTRMVRYRCHTGHAYSSASLTQGRSDDVERTLMETLRALHEREMMSRALSEHFAGVGNVAAQQREQDTARRAARAAGILQALIADS